MDLKSRRREKGWSQEQLADISGVSARTIQRLEKGEAAGMETLKSLASAFEVPLSKLQEDATSSEETDTMKDTANDANTSLIPKHWRGFFLHLLTFMVVITWLLALAFFFEFERSWILWLGYMWAMLLGIQAWNTANPDDEDK